MTDEVKSRAVVKYTSSGNSPFPYANPEAVLGMNVQNAAELVRYAEELVVETLDLFPLGWRGDQNNLDLSQAMELIGASIRERHPELDVEAASALAWMWGYSAWK